MFVVECVQGDPTWVAARAGVITASEMDEVMTPKGLKPAKGEAYLNRVVAEILTGKPVEFQSSGYMTRGKEMEPEAVAEYEFETGVECQEVGFILRDDQRVGCSPDRLVGEDGGLECKVPGAAAHVGHLRFPDEFVLEHRGQVQLCLLITGRKWWDLKSYSPKMPSVVRRCLPDPVWQTAANDAIEKFLARVDEALDVIGMPAAEHVPSLYDSAP